VRDSPVQKWLRDAKLDEIWDGTSDIMRLIVARSLFRRASAGSHGRTTCASSCSSGRRS
jgi:alkylation response protein AidB-like acyl-CoA dehydrogenase